MTTKTKSDFVIAGLTGGQLNALVKNLMKHLKIDDPILAVKTINAGKYEFRDCSDYIDPKKIRRQNGLIRFSVTSNNLSGPEWIKHLMSKGYHIGVQAGGILDSDKFVPTNGITTEIAILRGAPIAKSRDRFTNSELMFEMGYKRLGNLTLEHACLIRDMFTDEELRAMGADFLVIMHEAFECEDDNAKRLLVIHSNVEDPGWLSTVFDRKKIHREWDKNYSFAFSFIQKAKQRVC